MTQFVNDTLDDTNGVSLAAHTAATGGQWVQHSVHQGIWLFQGNRIYPSQVGAVYNPGDPASADYYAECTYRYISDVGSVGIAIRIQTGAQTFYYSYYLAGEWVLSKQVAGTITGLHAYTQALVSGNDYTLRLEAIGSAIKVYIDGVERMSVSDSSITAEGRAGVRSGSTVTTTTGKHIAAFSAVDTSNPLAPTYRSYVVG